MLKNNTPQKVRAKKHLGQHFLNDEQIAFEIVDAMSSVCSTKSVIEIGPGMGILTKYLLENQQFSTYAIDIDKESVEWLKQHFPALQDRLIQGDFLALDLRSLFDHPFSLIGNFPYNISSQIVFKVIELRDHIPLMVGMFQKEVAERIGAKPGGKDYGILSILTQVFYEVEYLFTVPEHVFTPPPKVKSGVIRMRRREKDFDTDVKMLFRVVKTAFNQRRKKLRNALQPFHLEDEVLKESGFSDKRAEQLSIEDFISLTALVIRHGKSHS